MLDRVRPDEVYNLAVQSHIHVSFDSPEYTENADAIGNLRMLEAIRSLGLTWVLPSRELQSFMALYKILESLRLRPFTLDGPMP